MGKYKRLPKHIGVIPDGNRRWAVGKGMSKHDGYDYGIGPGMKLYEACLELGVEEMTYYGFTMDNVKRPSLQTKAFQKACVDSVNALKEKDADLLVLGNTDSKVFPKELLPYANKRTKFGEGKMKVNFLVNYGWNWDLNHALKETTEESSTDFTKGIASKDISRMDMILRWGGRRRLSGFLPVQSIYSDIYVFNELWPAYKDEHLHEALSWYQETDVTLGG
ncbi:MAG: undecaprenyl diphosphate synthase family protein [Alkalibacterium sp.]|uniref:Undecaprenyl diphosphate synthase n=1 Tax=Alkalibacterium gilvum TaxID=1130080 RepID=A0A1H6RY56_9LACT|nr:MULTISPECIES: undecaprenyl diphosphate synthase family protein [Alkalibacterium]MDN6194363.1 undecaprenyl diphosphate synthase family protein [Alkalibacterium sp.]MDN6294494.1 undecaprenyl diphosphate synthase family protein [Alkalibacterium sp.]MDN6296143.1 undecaprenyl diphosphate synthase family protein [Alkalibacterium sp.]MDN6327606.1 undecaprenyl diphosphate synthase family protein [Alkalibacterium sp.]MDN6729785.1 undecaprenyl diphosphate synthase family protein [Alkalibacterium sp.]